MKGLIALLLLGLVSLGHAAGKDHKLEVEVSLKPQQVTLSKEQQLGEWLELKDEKYNSKGFYAWKPQPEGFIMKNKDTNQLSCHVKTNTASSSALAVGFNCDILEKKTDVVKSAAAGMARFRAKMNSKFTPMQGGFHLKPLDPELQFEHEQDAAGAMASHGTWGREVNIDDSVFEGESNNALQDIETASEKDEHEERHYLDKVDVGPGDLFHKEEEKEQSHASHVGVINRRSKHQHLERHFKHLIDTPYVDAGVDREVNDRMYEFFKKHPQYHTPEAHWRSARKWKTILNRSEGKAHGVELDQQVNGGLWSHNSCSAKQKVPIGWPDVPTMKCRHYAVSPMGYWGCQWLFEDGTCGFIQFYPTIRWDGLDAYVSRTHDPEDKELEINGAFVGRSN